jgi:hypothetical protein
MKKHTTESIINKLKIIFKDENYDYSKVEYIDYNTKIKIICPKHDDFEKTPKQLSLGKGCPDCSLNKPSINKLIDEFNEIHNNKFKYKIDKYENNRQHIQVYCPEHGWFPQTIKNHKKYGCKKCSEKYLDNEMFIKKANKIHNNLYTYENTTYTDNKGIVIIDCPKHGLFEQIANDHLNGSGCPTCKNSNGEKIIFNYLKENMINFEIQKKFEDCKDKRVLPFDFYLTEKNTCIEYDGKQHYEIVENWNGIDGLKDRMKKDKIKSDFCIKNKIKLIRIKYDENVVEKLNNCL